VEPGEKREARTTTTRENVELIPEITFTHKKWGRGG
jgi:hypothetical protein